MTISRAIEILDPRTFTDVSGDEAAEACRMGMEALKRQRWIPVSERLPEQEFNIYLVARTSFPDDQLYSRIGYWDGVDWLTTEKRKNMTKTVVYWMPLPEPPEKGGTGSEEK